MLFKFLKYLQPTQYFTLLNKQGNSVFPIIDQLPKNILNKLEFDDDYVSPQAKKYDLSWQAIQKGYIGATRTYNDFEKIPLRDEYHFASKYFSRAWVVYVLIIRLLGFKNPYNEIIAFLKSSKVKRSRYLKTPLTYLDWAKFDSKLIKEHPKLTVIIPTLNRYQYLKDVLEDLEKQTYKNFDVIVVDQSQPFQKSFYDTFKLDLKVFYQKERALWKARNFAITESENDFFLLFDDDSRVSSDWIFNHLKCLDFFNAQMSSGVSISTVGEKTPENYAFFRLSDQLDTGNVLIKKEVFNQIGLFDRQFEKQRMGDGEYGLRGYLEGFLNISNPYAKRIHLKVASGGLREMGSWDAFRTKKWFAPMPIPSVLYFYRNYFGSKAAKYALLRTIPFSLIPYRFKKNKLLKIFGGFLTIFITPIIIVQVIKSWRLSTKKIKEGFLIDSLN